MKRMLDTLRPKIEQQLKSWGSCIPDGGNTAPGERLSEVAVMLRAKFRNYLQAVVEKLVENVSSFLAVPWHIFLLLKKCLFFCNAIVKLLTVVNSSRRSYIAVQS